MTKLTTLQPLTVSFSITTYEDCTSISQLLTCIGMNRFLGNFDGMTFNEFIMVNDGTLKTMKMQLLHRRAIVIAVVTYKINKGLI